MSGIIQGFPFCLLPTNIQDNFILPHGEKHQIKVFFLPFSQRREHGKESLYLYALSFKIKE
jgi:hypothetical protein